MVFKVPGGEALYLQIADEIKKDLAKLRYGQQIPSEAELIERYKVSRGTIRQAISGLVSTGFLFRIQGKGTYRGNGLSNYDVRNYLPSFSNTLLLVGKTPSISDVRLSSIPADEYVSSMLCIPPGEEVWRLERFRGEMGREPYCYAIAHIIKDFMPDLKGEDLELSLIDMVIEKYGIKVSSTSNSVFLAKLGDEISLLTGLDSNKTVLCSEFVIRTEDGQPVLFDCAKNWGDDFKYSFESNIDLNKYN